LFIQLHSKIFTKSRSVSIFAVLYLLAMAASGEGRDCTLFISALFTLLYAGGDVGNTGADLMWDLLARFSRDLARHLVQDLLAVFPGNIMTQLLLHLVANLLVHGFQNSFCHFVALLLRDLPADLFRHLLGYLVRHIIALCCRNKPAALNIFRLALFLVNCVADFLWPTAGVLLTALLSGNILARLCWHQVTLVLLDLPALLPVLHIMDGPKLGAAFLTGGEAALVLVDGLRHLLLHGVALHLRNAAALVLQHQGTFSPWYRVEDGVKLCVAFASGLRSTFLSGRSLLDREVDNGAAAVVLDLCARDLHVLADGGWGAGGLRSAVGGEHQRQETSQDKNLHNAESSLEVKDGY